MDFDTSPFDVIVAGGGPAGSTAAALLARQGHRVLLAERSAEPQLKVGESLMPACYWTFERLGLLEAMRGSEFTVKQSVQFFTRDGRPTAPFYFFENDPHESSRTWQVVRSEFDQLLMDNAERLGATVRRGLAVKEVLFEGDRAVGARLESADGETAEVAAKVVVDATGQSALLSRALDLREVEPCLQNAAVFSHFEGARRDCGVDEGATLILHTESGRSWFWYIPLPDDRVSVGVVGRVDQLISGRKGAAKGDPQAIFEEELERCPALAPRLEGARQLFPMKVTRDFSYRSRRVAGDGWVLAGDALGFLDPIYSTGVFLAFKSGEMAADAIHEALEAGDPSAERLGAFGPEFLEGLGALRQLVYAFYDPQFSFSEFLKRFPQCRQGLVHMLVGNVYREDVSEVLEALETLTAEAAERHRRAAETSASETTAAETAAVAVS